MGVSAQEMNMEIEERLESRDSNRYDVLDRKIKVLHNTAWRDKWQWESDQYSKWLANFEEGEEQLNAMYMLSKFMYFDKWQWESDQYSKWLANFEEGEEQLNAMYMLSKFMYFDNETIRELMVRIYEDLYKRPIVYDIRKKHRETKDEGLIESEFEKVRAKTRFLSIGNPSESSAHLLYYFRQENYLKRDLFIGPHELFVHNENGEIITAKLAIDGIDRIVVLDDFCGSGNQATKFNNEFVKFIKEKNKDIHISYFALFAIEEGLEKVNNLSFDIAKSVFVLDKSYKCFSDESRFFDKKNASLKEPCKFMCEKYGKQISKIPMGYNDCQMLLGFHHNTPNNTLPIFWKEKDGWIPMFKRFAKLY